MFELYIIEIQDITIQCNSEFFQEKTILVIKN